MNNKKFVLAMVSKVTIVLLEIGFFAIVLFQYYGPAIFSNMESVGFTVTLLLYIIVYIALGNLFRAFKIADYSILETVFSQLLAFGIADLLLYGEFCMIRHNYVNLVPGLMTVGCQLLAALLWGLLAKRMTMLFSKPEKTLIVTGTADTREFIRKLRKLKYILWVEKVVPYDTLRTDWKMQLDPYDAVIFYEVGSSSRRSEMLWYCMQSRKSLYITPQLDEITMQGFGARHLIDTPLMKYEYHSERFWYNLFKRISDIVVSLLALIVTSPIFLAVSAAIKLEDRGPVFFKQKRCTKNGRVFEIIKFRSMVVDAERNGSVIPCRSGDPRITRVGRIIRKLRIDELPQILNVLKGDMALIGPRPALTYHPWPYEQYNEHQKHMFDVLPGVTGWAQVNGRKEVPWPERIELNVWYAQHMNFGLDLKIFFMTIAKVVTNANNENVGETGVKSKEENKNA